MLEPRGLFGRVALLALLFAAELLTLSLWIDTHSLRGRGGLAGTLYLWVPPMASATVVAATTFFTFACLKAGAALQGLFREPGASRFSPQLLAGHFLSTGLFAAASRAMFAAGAPGGPGNALTCAWALAGFVALGFGAFAFLRPEFCWRALRATGAIWVYALSLGLLAPALYTYGWTLWRPSAALTFQLAQAILRPLLPGAIADPSNYTVGTAAFRVQIGPSCSGVEGVALILLFSLVWLWIFRRSCRFPQALALIPLGVALMWVLNGLRIALLILIGNAGAPNLAVNGFHSQAGWIGFNAVAFGFAAAARNIGWFSVRGGTPGAKETAHGDDNAAYLVPLLAMLGAAMLNRAAGLGSNWLGAIEIACGAAVAWGYRRDYRRLDWRFGWESPLCGGAAFAVWLALERLSAGSVGVAAAPAEKFAGAGAIAAWLLTSAIAEPVAEELAFRGFLLRRMVSPRFLSVPTQAVTWAPAVISSCVFGVLHADRWLAATLGGLLYAYAFLRRGRIGDAVAAHVTSNAMLAAYLVLTGRG
jgi:exosortase E/protease (VPEID-CTERM system)